MLSLIRLKNAIKQRKIANLESLANEFHVSTDELLPLLSILIAKGYICERKGQQCGTTCNKCAIKAMKIYYWLDN